jgi:hypothetical protein
MSEMPDPLDYLRGRTAQCYRSGCSRRLKNKDDVICYLCKHAEENPDYKEEYKAAKNAQTSKWFFLWTYPAFPWEAPAETIICKCCEAKAPADDFGEYKKGVFKPFIAHCPRTKTCKAAAAYWGKDTEEPFAALKLYKVQREESLAEKQAATPQLADTVIDVGDPDEVDANFDDEDFIDLQKPRHSKPISIKLPKV